jgi:hypothetical protein
VSFSSWKYAKRFACRSELAGPVMSAFHSEVMSESNITFLVLYYLVSYFTERKSLTLVQRFQGFFVAPAFGSDFYHLSQSKGTQGFGSRLVPVAWFVQAGSSVYKRQLQSN